MERRRKEHGAAALLFAVILNLLFFPYIWGNMNLLSGAHDVSSITDLGGPNGDPARPIAIDKWKLLDANGSGQIGEPAFALVHRELFTGHEIPLWNPDVAFGAPLAAEMQQQPFYPLTAIVMLHPSPTTFALYIVLRLFVAGFGTYLFMRFFTSFWPAMVSGVAFMIGGYFIHYSTMPHLSVETLTGALFLGVEWVLRRRRVWLAVPYLAAVTSCDLLGGMPESSFITITFAAAYGFYRIATVEEYRSAWRPNAKHVSVAFTCGFALAAFLLLPFAEYVFHSFNIHEASKNGGTLSGTIIDTSPRTSLILYLMPLIFGPPWQAGAAGIIFNYGYCGIAVVFFAVVAITSTVTNHRRDIARPIWFFAGCTALLLAKRFGLPAVNWVGYLPIVKMITLVKYEECATAFAIASLAGFGVHAILENRSRSKATAIVAATLTLTILQTAYSASVPEVRNAVAHANLYLFFAVACAVVALVGCATLAVFAASVRRNGRPNAFGAAAMIIVTAELALSYFVPMYYVVDPGPSKGQNPYLGARYVDFLHDATHDGARIYGEATAQLSPNWAEAFDIRDVRNIDAIYNERYFPFVKSFLPADDSEDLAADFSGTGHYTMGSPAGQRFLSLASVHYVLANNIEDTTSLAGRVDGAVLRRPADTNNLRFAPCRVNHTFVQCLTQTANSAPLDVRFQVPQGARAIAVDLSAGTSETPNAHASVDFTLALTDARGVARVAVKQRSSAKPSPVRTWIHRTVDVTRYAGTTIQLTFTVRTNPHFVTRFGIWAAPRTVPETVSPRPFSIHRIDETNVFEFSRPLPRGALYESVSISQSDRATLALLADPQFDLFRRAVVSAESVPSSLVSNVEALSRQSPGMVRAASLETHSATRVSYSVESSRVALFSLNDTFYPGWYATVDSKPVPILRTNFLFRGVLVGPGKHTIDFRYDPLSFKIGVVLAACGALALLVFSVTTKRRETKVGTLAPA